MIARNKPIDRITQLLQSGLIKDQRRIAYYRAILQNPRSAFNNGIYRDLAGELLDTLTNYVLNDTQIYNRLRQDLIANRRLQEMRQDASDREQGTDSALQNYIEDTPGQSKIIKTIKKVVKEK